MDETLIAVAMTAHRHIPASLGAGMFLVATRSTPRFHCTTSKLVDALDSRQAARAGGPGLTAAHEHVLVRTGDLVADQRWPDLHTEAREAGAHSMIAVPVAAHHRVIGALTVYSRSVDAFSTGDEVLGVLVAKFAGAAVSTVARESEFRAALASRDVIGQAKGIIMERHALSPDRAFAVLVRLSQNTNTPVATLARDIVMNGPSSPRLRTTVESQGRSADGRRRLRDQQ